MEDSGEKFLNRKGENMLETIFVVHIQDGKVTVIQSKPREHGGQMEKGTLCINGTMDEAKAAIATALDKVVS
jgi:hypothetical protein